MVIVLWASIAKQPILENIKESFTTGDAPLQ